MERQQLLRGLLGESAVELRHNSNMWRCLVSSLYWLGLLYLFAVRCTGLVMPPSSMRHVRLSASVSADRERTSEGISRDTRSYLLSTAGVILPTLSRADKATLLSCARVQKVDRQGHSGYGMVVLDVPAPPDIVFDVLTRFDRYMEMIPTVRSAKIFSSNEKSTLAEFSLSKFRLKVNVLHTLFREQRVIKFSLDNSRQNLVMRQAEGFWHVQVAHDHPGHSRVYLSTNIIVANVIPSIIVDYAAARALPRATTWLENFDFTQEDQTFMSSSESSTL